MFLLCCCLCWVCIANRELSLAMLSGASSLVQGSGLSVLENRRYSMWAQSLHHTGLVALAFGTSWATGQKAMSLALAGGFLTTG